jgi:hypothetical protein
MSEDLSLSLELELKTVFSALITVKNMIAGYQDSPDGYVFQRSVMATTQYREH